MQFLIQIVVSCLLALLLPLVFLYLLYLSCTGENNCSLLILPKMPSNYHLFDKTTITYVFGWFIFQGLLAALPVGKITTGPSIAKQENKKMKYRLNGLLGFVISLFTFGGLIYCEKFPMDIIHKEYFSLVTGTYIFSFLVSFVVLIISRQAEKAEQSEGILQDFVFGRVINPRLFGGKYDIKTTAFKAGFISWGVLNLVYLANVWNQSIESNGALILLVLFQLWYILDHMIFEETNLYTSSLSSEKIGFTGLSLLLLFFPLFCSLQAKFLSLYPIKLPWWHYVLASLLQVIGYLIYRSSVMEKFHFRKDPHKAKLSGAVYISTSKGKDLLVGGWWGKLRHPNYLGDLLMNYSWALLCGFSHLFPWIWAIALTIMLILMAWRDDALCLKKYGKYWEEYQDKVKYKMIPFIY